MKQFFTVVAFILLTIGFFAGYSNFGIPQIEPAPPPKEEKLDLGSMTMDQFIALGDRIFQGKVTCTLCHNSLGRAPMLGTIAEVFPKRLKDERSKGEAEDLEAYLVESLVEPSAFVVAGFGKKGTNDAESPMPNVSGGSIGLSEAEVAAVVAYLQDQAPRSRLKSRPMSTRRRKRKRPRRGRPWPIPRRSWPSSPVMPAT